MILINEDSLVRVSVSEQFAQLLLDRGGWKIDETVVDSANTEDANSKSNKK